MTGVPAGKPWSDGDVAYSEVEAEFKLVNPLDLETVLAIVNSSTFFQSSSRRLLSLLIRERTGKGQIL